jgi:hypothetical protein
MLKTIVPMKEIFTCGECGELGHYFHCHFKNWTVPTPFAPEDSLKQNGWLLIEAEHIVR